MPYLKPKVCICVDKVDSDWKVCFHPDPPRLLLTLTEEEFSKAPYTIESSSHRRAILMELERVKALGVKPPQNLWEYKVDTQFLQWKKKKYWEWDSSYLSAHCSQTWQTQLKPLSGCEPFLGLLSYFLSNADKFVWLHSQGTEANVCWVYTQVLELREEKNKKY